MVPLIFGHSLFGYVVAEHYVKTVRNSRDTTNLINALYGVSFCSSAAAAIYAFVMVVLAGLGRAIEYPCVNLYAMTVLKLVPVMILDHIKDRIKEPISPESRKSVQNQNGPSLSRFSADSLRPSRLQHGRARVMRIFDPMRWF
ncbi:hypothetical protein V2A60_008728 [Cordyceps javanica]